MKRILGICALALLVTAISASAATITPSNYIAMKSSAAASTVWPIDFSVGGSVVSEVTSAILSKSSLLAVPGSPALNQWSATGWNNANQYFDFQVNMASGKGFIADTLYIAGMRSSSTGPTSIVIKFSKDGGAEQQIDAFASVTTGYINKMYNVASLIGTVNSSLDIRVYGTGATASTGTFRMGDYTGDGGANYTPFGITGAVFNTPEPATMAILGLGGLMMARRRRA